MASPTSILLCRHGTTEANERGLFLGQMDVALNANGQREAEALARRLAGEPLDHIVSSDLRRAFATAEATAAAHPDPLSVVAEPRFREMHLGDLDGVPAVKVHSEHPDLMTRWLADPSEVRMPGEGAETLLDVQRRAWEAIEELAESHRGQRVAVFAHTFTLLMITCRAINLPLPSFRHLFLDRASISELRWGKWGPALVRFNDTAHIPKTSD